MSYESLERMVLAGIGAALVASALLSALLGVFSLVALTIQVLVAVVALAAGRYGRRGGSAAALTASIVYVLVQGNASARSPLPSPSTLAMVWPIAAFGLVGIAGGYVLTLLKYDRERFTEDDALDEWSRLYNQRHFFQLLDRARKRFDDSGEPCCVVLLRITYPSPEDQRASRQRLFVRIVASQIVDGVRLVDDCARLDDGSFAVLMRGYTAARGSAVAERLRAMTLRVLHAQSPTVDVRCTGLPDRDAQFMQLLESAPLEAAYETGSGS